MINQPTDVEKQKYYNSDATQTSTIEEKEVIADDMNIISNNALHDDSFN